MFRFFENLVNPFADSGKETPPASLWPFVWSQLAPFKPWLIWMALTGFLVAVMESGLIFYSGRIIDLMTDSGTDTFWSVHSWELLIAGAFILFLRPLMITLNHLFLEQTLASNMQEQVRWQNHKYMLGQSMGFFQNDFAGRLSNRVMQVGPAVEDGTYMAFEGLWYAATYVVGSILILSQIDIRLGIPLTLWLVAYILYVRKIAVRVAVASEKWSDARSLVTGRVVDAYSNIETVKLFAHGESEEAYALSAMRRLRLRFQRFCRLMTELSFGLNLINGVLITSVVGPAIWLWSNNLVTIGEVAAASALTLRLNGMSGWIMWVAIQLFERAGVIREGLRSISVPQEVVDKPDATPLVMNSSEIRFENLSHHYGKQSGGLDHINLTIPSGQRVGLVGRSGAGQGKRMKVKTQ